MAFTKPCGQCHCYLWFTIYSGIVFDATQHNGLMSYCTHLWRSPSTPINLCPGAPWVSRPLFGYRHFRRGQGYSFIDSIPPILPLMTRLLLSIAIVGPVSDEVTSRVGPWPIPSSPVRANVWIIVWNSQESYVINADRRIRRSAYLSYISCRNSCR